MFCPQCSQQQVSADVRFCSRCGFPLGVVSTLLESGGALTDVQGETKARRDLTPRQRGTRKGGIVMIGAFALMLLVVMLTLVKDDFLMLMPVVALFFVGGLLRTLYALWLEDNGHRSAGVKSSSSLSGRGVTQLEGVNARAGALPVSQSISVMGFTATPRASQTAEMVLSQPPSVTDGTTRLLDDEVEHRD